jgi:hypothetical protein
MKPIFIGSKARPTYLVEIHPAKKQIHIYKPDRFSKNEEFYEKYSLGQPVLTATYDKIIVQPVAYKHYLHAPEMIIIIKKKPIRIATTIREIRT